MRNDIWEVGDRFEITVDSLFGSYKKGDRGTIISLKSGSPYCPLRIRLVNGKEMNWRDDNDLKRLTPPKEAESKNMGNKLSALATRFLDKRLKKLYKAGFIDSCNELTDLGREHLEVVVLVKHLDELTKAADEVLAERKHKKCKECDDDEEDEDDGVRD